MTRFSIWCRREGIKLTPRHYAYLKISEGCNNRCTFCIIPKLRGDLVSRPAADVLRRGRAPGRRRRQGAAGHLAGHFRLWDRSQIRPERLEGPRSCRPSSSTLAGALGELGVWVRLHYVYPYPHVDEVIPLMAEGKALPYLDVPFQHASPDVLKRMKRPAAQEKTLERIRRWRAICPDLTIRSTFIVGFPGETEADFQLLLDWLGEAELDRVGCFRYEPVAGATANDLAAPVPAAVKEERWHRLMARQQAISPRRLKRKIGTRQQVIIDEVGADGRQRPQQGRRAGDRRRGLCASHRPLRVGEIATVKIERADDYDLHGTAVGF